MQGSLGTRLGDEKCKCKPASPRSMFSKMLASTVLYKHTQADSDLKLFSVCHVEGTWSGQVQVYAMKYR